MATYVALLNWTDQGIKSVKDTADRAESVEALAQKMGARMSAIYWTVGPYDLVAVLDAPDEETAHAFLLQVGTAGNVRSTGMRAYNGEEMRGLLSKLD